MENHFRLLVTVLGFIARARENQDFDLILFDGILKFFDLRLSRNPRVNPEAWDHLRLVVDIQNERVAAYYANRWIVDATTGRYYARNV
jgi:hypothetical protein